MIRATRFQGLGTGLPDFHREEEVHPAGKAGKGIFCGRNGSYQGTGRRKAHTGNSGARAMKCHVGGWTGLPNRKMMVVEELMKLRYCTKVNLVSINML